MIILTYDQLPSASLFSTLLEWRCIRLTCASGIRRRLCLRPQYAIIHTERFYAALPGAQATLTHVVGVKPARYKGRFHWVSSVDVARFPADYLMELVQDSYTRAAASLTHAQRAAIV